jgi:hypothetical protein
MTAKSLRRRLSHLFKHAPATSAISPTSGVSLLYRTEAIGRQQTHTPQKIRGDESVLSAPHINSHVGGGAVHNINNGHTPLRKGVRAMAS